MKRKLVSLLLAGVMTVSLLVGCGSNGPKETEGTQSSTTEVKQSSEASGSEEQKKPEMTTLKILCAGTNWPDDWEEYPVVQEILSDLEEIGIRLEMEIIDSEFGNVVKTRMAAGVDLPDLVSYVFTGSEEDVLAWAESDLIYSVNELLEQYDEDGSIRAFYDEMAPGAWERNATADGTSYWFTYFSAGQGRVDAVTGKKFDYTSPRTLSIRADWVEAVGEELKTVYTPDELFALLKKMQEQDANGNGKADEIVHLGIGGYTNGIATGFGLSTNRLAGYFEGENQVFNNLYHENFSAYIEFMQNLYNEGLYDTASLSAASTREMVSTDRISLVYDYAYNIYETLLPNYDEEKVYYMPIVLDMDGKTENGFSMRIDSISAMTYGQYFVPKASKNAEAVVRLMDYVYSERYAKLCQLGIEGKGYEVDANGGYKQISGDINENKELACAYEIGFGLYGLPRIAAYPEVYDVTSQEGSVNLVEKIKWINNFDVNIFPDADHVEHSSQFLAIATDDEKTVVSEFKGTLDTYINELLSDLILGNKSLDDLEKYQKEVEELGLQKYIDTIQARRDRILGK